MHPPLLTEEIKECKILRDFAHNETHHKPFVLVSTYVNGVCKKMVLYLTKSLFSCGNSLKIYCV